MTARTPSRPLGRAVVVLAAAALATLACASCSGSSATAARSPRPRLTAEKAAQMLVQCFVDKHLIPAPELAAGSTSVPPSDSSTWLRDGKVIANLRFGGWYSIAGSAITIDGRTIGDRVTAVTGRSKAWPADICGPLPH